MRHRSLFIALSLVATVGAIFLVAYLGDGKVASIVDYNIPTTFTETVLEALSGLLTALFIGAYAAGFITDWEPAPLVTVVALAASLVVGVAIFWVAGNLFWLLVDIVLLAVTLMGLEKLVSERIGPNSYQRRRLWMGS